MRTKIILASTLLACCSISSTQVPSKEAAKSVVPVYVNHRGQDPTGSQFVAAVKRELSKSHKYELGVPNTSANERRFRLYIGISTLDVSSAPDVTERTSVASVVIEQMGLPNSWPVPSMWYHKVFLVKGNHLDELAQRFVADVDASWCNHIKSSVGNCPKETLAPIYP